MTRDYIQPREQETLPKFASVALKRQGAIKVEESPIELTRHSSFLDGEQDIFDLLAREPIASYKLKDKAVSLLSKAQNAIEKAEQTIAKQKTRINTLERLNMIDEVTGLHNRAGFEMVFKRELARTNRHHDHAGILVLIDMESYDSILERYGKDAANASLKLVSGILSNEIRDMDIAARLSKDEFALIFSNTAADKVVDRVQKLALRLNKLSFIWNGQEININASLGLRGYGPHDSFEALFKSHKNGQSAT